MIIGYVVRGKNRLFRYHLSQSLALVIFINVTLLFMVSFMGLMRNGSGPRGLALTYLFGILLLRIDGTSKAWRGKLQPLPIFGNSLGQFVFNFIQRAEPVMQKAWIKMRASVSKSL